jgi:hypothetical protein
MTMYMLSYDTEGTRVKASIWREGDIREFMLRLRARMGRRLLAYAWVAEKQKRGVIHYHVVIRHYGRAPMPDRAYMGRDELGHKRYFKRMWEKGASHSDFNVRSAYYLAKYVGKEYQKDFDTFPKNAHAWAVWVSDDALKLDLRIESLDKYRQELFCEAAFAEHGLGFQERWDWMEWQVKKKRLSEKMLGVNWEYVGQVGGADELASWGVTEELLQKKMVTRIIISCSIGV